MYREPGGTNGPGWRPMPPREPLKTSIITAGGPEPGELPAASLKPVNYLKSRFFTDPEHGGKVKRTERQSKKVSMKKQLSPLSLKM